MDADSGVLATVGPWQYQSEAGDGGWVVPSPHPPSPARPPGTPRALLARSAHLAPRTPWCTPPIWLPYDRFMETQGDPRGVIRTGYRERSNTPVHHTVAGSSLLLAAGSGRRAPLYLSYISVIYLSYTSVSRSPIYLSLAESDIPQSRGVRYISVISQLYLSYGFSPPRGARLLQGPAAGQ